MGKIKRYKNSIERFLSGDNGQRFFNFAYSIGAAIVIWGALFKILHIHGGDTLLSIGMGTEVLMFILTAFDRPPKSYNWEEVFPVLASKNPDDRPEFGGSAGGVVITGPGQNDITGQSVIVSGNGVPGVESFSADPQSLSDNMALMATEMKQLSETTHALNEVSATLLASYRAITDNSDSINSSSNGYVEQMQALNRNIAGLNTIYEIQLKSVSSQLDAIDRVNRGIKEIRDMYERSSDSSAHYCEETEKMARNMKQLNHVYEQMLRAMSVNMAGAAMAAAPSPVNVPSQTAAASPNNNSDTSL